MADLDLGNALELLSRGEIEVEGRLVEASNATLLCSVAADGAEARCVYKPVAGERPLWDFPDGTLAGREVAAYAVSDASGWGLVPPTILRDGPFGPGMCQLWVEPDPGTELVDVLPAGPLPDGWLHVLDALGAGGQPVVLAHADDPRLRRMAVFDAIVNNADRKGGHVLPQPDGRVLGVDHGVSFHTEGKLRTVLWGWAGDPLTDEESVVLDRLATQLDGSLGSALGDLLTRAEITATRRRIRRLRSNGSLPFPAEGWPAIPWPPF